MEFAVYTNQVNSLVKEQWTWIGERSKQLQVMVGFGIARDGGIFGVEVLASSAIDCSMSRRSGPCAGRTLAAAAAKVREGLREGQGAVSPRRSGSLEDCELQYEHGMRRDMSEEDLRIVEGSRTTVSGHGAAGREGIRPGRRRAIGWIVAALMSCWLFPGSAVAYVELPPIEGASKRYSLAVSPSGTWEAGRDVNGLSGRIADVIGDDLDRSGWFRIIDRSAYLEHPRGPASGWAASISATGPRLEPKRLSRAASGPTATTSSSSSGCTMYPRRCPFSESGTRASSGTRGAWRTSSSTRSS